MLKIGYHASHEQFKPSTLLTYVQRAQQAGFTAASSSDHFHPWSNRQGESGFAWSWLGAALQATSLSFGVVSAPGQRYHPAIIAQAAATLAEMFPERFWMAVGTGQFLNEHITELRMPDQFDMAGELVNLQEVDKMVRISSDPAQRAAWLQDDMDMGFQQLMLHNVNLEQERFIDDFGQHVLPRFLKVEQPNVPIDNCQN